MIGSVKMVGPVNVVRAVRIPCVEASRGTDFWRWYWEILEKGEMTNQNTPSPGCYMLKVRTYWTSAFPSYPDLTSALPYASQLPMRSGRTYVAFLK